VSDHALAERNGKIAAKAGRPIAEANPYPRGTRNHEAFERGFRHAFN